MTAPIALRMRRPFAFLLGGFSMVMLPAALPAETPAAPAFPDAIVGAVSAVVPDPIRHVEAEYDADAGDEDAPPGISFGRALDLQGTPITLVTRTARSKGSRFAPGRNTGLAVMPSGSPLRFASISSGFGSRWHPVYGQVRFHAGVDMAAPSGTPVYVTSSGVVIAAGSCGGYGQCVAVDHGGGVVSLYGHLSRVDVYPGRQVGSGQEIGLVGSTGVSTGPHLHYEIRINGSPVNPRPYL